MAINNPGALIHRVEELTQLVDTRKLDALEVVVEDGDGYRYRITGAVLENTFGTERIVIRVVE